MNFLPTNTARNMVGAAVLILICALVAGLFLFELPEGNREVALVVLGTVVGWGGLVVGFHYGSSEGSKHKTELLAQGGGNASDPA